MSLCLITQFKNERHIMYEFIQHYLEEGVDCFILIDDNSDDDYLELNKDWLDDLIKSNKIIIKKALHKQEVGYNDYLELIKTFTWVIICDMDEFFFSIPEKSTLKSLLNNQLSKYDYISVPWKLFTHKDYSQPKSVISDNLYTHNKLIDPTSPSKGYKSIVKSRFIRRIEIHNCILHGNAKRVTLNNCHNSWIHNNHYRTQSEEFLRGVKEVRGGGVHKNKYKKFNSHKHNIYDKKCQLLKNKRRDLINKCLTKDQIKPQIHTDSSFFKENNKKNNI